MNPNIDELIEKLINGDMPSLAKAITISESYLDSDRIITKHILNKINQTNKQSLRLGISGTPGVGKSTFIEAIGLHLIKNNKKVAVLAVDPSSEISKGSIMGDKTRMENLSKQDNAFIRPSASGGTLGGTTARTREAILLCEAAGYDIVMIETVGVGQSETAVKSMVDLFLVLLQPGGGDDLQGIKKGIIELSDYLIINKADGENKKLANITKLDYQKAMKLLGRKNKILKCSSVNGDGIEEIWQEISDDYNTLVENELINSNRKKQKIKWFYEELRNNLIIKFINHNKIKALCQSAESSILQNTVSISDAIENIVNNCEIKN